MSRRTAVIAKRVAQRPIQTAEIRALADSAGYEVVGEVTQVREEDSSTNLGAGKVETLAARVESTGAEVVVVDNDLGPQQAADLADAVAAEVKDRKRLVLDIFGERASTRRARLEVRLAELRYELPRAQAAAESGEDTGRAGFRSQGEDPASQLRAHYKQQIAEVREELANLDTDDGDRRRRRHEAGFDLVALAGYTNAGKSTLLRRLADDLSVAEPDHGDLTAAAESGDYLFTTLGTTTRRATLDGRRLLLTDTVGFVSGIPHWLVDSFTTTLSAAYEADAVLLAVDASDPRAAMRRKVETSLDVLRDHRDGEVVPVLTKSDAADADAARDALRDLLDDPLVATPAVATSATEGRGLGALSDRLAAALPEDERTTLTVPNTDAAQGFVSWLHDHARVQDVTYGEAVTVTVEGRPEVVAQAEGRAADLR